MPAAYRAAGRDERPVSSKTAPDQVAQVVVDWLLGP